MDNDMSSVALNFRRNAQVCPERNKNAAVDEVKLLPIWVPTRMCVNKEEQRSGSSQISALWC